MYFSNLTSLQFKKVSQSQRNTHIISEKVLITHTISANMFVFILVQAGQSMIIVRFYAFIAPGSGQRGQGAWRTQAVSKTHRHLMRNVINRVLYLKRQSLSGKWLLFPVRGAARKDNVSSDIPAHRSALITPPLSLVASGSIRKLLRTQLTVEMVAQIL